MKNSIRQTRRKILLAYAVLGATVLLTVSQAQAQTIYRVVGADGRITFSDKPPAVSDNATALSAGGKVTGTGGSALPFELRQVAGKYPVTLYTSSNCAPCGAGRALLSNRGIPFAEKTITTPEDAEALQRIGGESALPFLTIGGQQIKGYADAEWTQFLNAAGYPQTSTLPASYRNPAATPLVTLQKPESAAAKAEDKQPQRAPAEPRRPPVDSTSNPAGITF